MPKKNTSCFKNSSLSDKTVGLIKKNNNIYKVFRPKYVNTRYRDLIIKHSKEDLLLKKYTHDSQRFKDLNSFNLWYEKSKIIYLLLDNNHNLSGIIWFTNNKETSLKTNLPYWTFAIRIYKSARGMGLSEDFFHISHKDLLNMLKKSKFQYDGLWLKTNSENKIANHLYHKLGFKKIQKKNNEVIMALET